MESGPFATIDIPIMAPTMVCVVDTGSSRKVANANHRPADSKAHNIPYANRSGVSS